MENKKEQTYSKKSIPIGILLFVGLVAGVVLYQEAKSLKEKTENETAKVSLNLDLHMIAEKLEKDSTFLNAYLNTYIETDGAIFDFTKYDQGIGVCVGMIGVYKTDSALFVHYPLDYESLLVKKDLTDCENEKLMYRRVDKRKQASSFIYTNVRFADKVFKDIKPVIYNSTCGMYICRKYTTCYQLQYFTIERMKVKGLLKKIYKNSESIYCLEIDNAVIISREKLLK